jgi:hypothetical protein
MMRKLVLILFLFLTNITSYADIHHYNDLILGERASGMAGAYSAVADDPSGAYYNPAGLAYCQKSYVSLSASSFKNSVIIYENVIGDYDWKTYSSAIIPSFFGMVQDFGKLKLAFSMIVPQAESINQDVSVYIKSQNNPTANNTRVIRNYDENNFLYMLGPSIAYEISESLSIGTSVFLNIRDRKWTDNQWSNKYLQDNEWEWQNKYSEESCNGITGIFGLQFMPDEQLSLSVVLENSYDFYAKASQQTIIATANSNQATEGEYNLLDLGYNSIPLSLRTGAAYYFSPYLLWTCDIKWHPGYDGANEQFDKKEVVNFASGLEYYYSQNIPIRIGYYTNKSNLKSYYDGAYNIDLQGITMSIGLENEFSTFSVGLDYSYGRGNIQIGDTLFDAKMENLYLFFAGSYML